MPEKTSCPTVAIVGARGLVGQEALGILGSLGWPCDSVRLFGSSRSVGEAVAYAAGSLTIEPLGSILHCSPSYALLCADADTARTAVDMLAGGDCTIIDNSSAFRLTRGVPLVIPEINGELLEHSTRLIANPNCSTIMLLTAINPLRAAFGVRSIQVSTYQAVSGAGRAGVETLRSQTRAALDGDPIPSGIFPVPCAFDVFEHESALDPSSGFNGEESKMIAESRKIWDSPELRVLPTCVRVPVERAHAQAITIEMNHTVSISLVREVLQRAPGVRLAEGHSPLTPASVAGRDEVWIGRIRTDPDDARRVLLWVCCDQIRKGAALNAIQIMQHLILLRDQSSSSNGVLTSVTEMSG